MADERFIGEGEAPLVVTLELDHLVLVGLHGALDEEASRPQPFELDLRVEVDCSKCSQNDQLGDAVDYGEVLCRAAAVVHGPHIKLLEVLARRICEAVLDISPLVLAVTVVVRKTRPPVPYDLLTAGARLTLGRPGSGV